MNAINKRDRLISAASILFHRKGIMATSLADIAKDAEIPIGNVYYYFKTKEELALSAIQRHKEQYIERFKGLSESIDNPRERLKKAIDYYAESAEDFTRYGCPIGKLVVDSEIEGGAITKTACEVLECFLQWAEVQFMELGQGEQSQEHAAKLLCGIQGAVVLAKATRDKNMLLGELNRLSIFVDHLPNKRITLGKVGIRAGAA